MSSRVRCRENEPLGDALVWTACEDAPELVAKMQVKAARVVQVSRVLDTIPGQPQSTPGVSSNALVA
eukprot:9080618-Alexandrium_andersonii.AAC.1